MLLKIPFWRRKSSLAATIKKTGFLDPDEILADSSSLTISALNPEGKMERSINKFPLFIFTFLMGVGVLYLFFRAVALQVASGDALFSRSQENRFLTRPIFPPRGIIYDKNGRKLVENEPSFGLSFEREKFLNKKGDLGELLRRLEKILDKPPEYFFDLGFPENSNSGQLPSRIFISQDLPVEKVVALTPQLYNLPGVEIFESYKRIYQDSPANSALVGFIGKISQEELDKNPRLRKEENIGKAGVEAYYDDLLRGRGGRKIVEIDSRGKETRFKLVDAPQAGAPLNLTADGGLQKKAYELLEHYTEGRRAGSVVAIDPKNGAVRALVSFPGFDSNAFGYGISNKEFGKILQNSLKPFFNRAVAGEFPSGSVIKPLLAAAALQEKIIDPEKKIYDPGYLEIANPYHPEERAIYADWQRQGWINFYDAIAMSANVYFYILGGGYGNQRGLGIEKIKKYAERFGLGAKLGIDLPGEKAGFLPDPETKKDSNPEDPVWRIGDTYNVSIGQGGLKVTPLQMAAAAAAIINGGKLYRPFVLKDKPPELIRDNVVDPENLKLVVRGMRQAVTNGTAHKLNDLPIAVAAKTGTAQTSGNQRPHAWAMVFAPAENPELALIVMVENGGEGSAISIPIAHDLLGWYFSAEHD